MPLTSKLNLEVGARTWRFSSGDPISGGVPERGGYFETVPRAGRTTSKASSTVSSAARPTQALLKAEPTVKVAPPDPGPSEEALRLEVEKRILAEEKLKIEEMNHQAQQTLEQAEMIRQKVTEAQELNAMAAEKEAQQRLAHQQAIEEEKQQIIFEADRKLQQLREEAAVVRQKHQAELALWQERQERTLALENEAEARAKAREATEEARAQRERELVQERTDTLERMKQEADEYYKELRRTQEEQLRKELEDARQKIMEESAARKASLEAEREATILKVKEEAQREYQKQLDSHLQLGKETADALKEASAKAAEEFKAQSQEAIKNLRSVAIDSCPRSERSAAQRSSTGKTSSPNPTLQRSSTGKTSSPDPTLNDKASSSAKVRRDKPPAPQVQLSVSQEEILKRREALRQKLLMGVYTPNVNRVHEWGLRSAPAPFPVAAPSPSWGSPSNRQRANSVGQANLSTPFLPGSARVSHLNQQIAPNRGGYSHDLYPRTGNLHPPRGDLYGNHSTAQAVTRIPAIAHASPAPSVEASNRQGDICRVSNNKHDQWGASAKKHDPPNKDAHQAPNKETYIREQPYDFGKQSFHYNGDSKQLDDPYDDPTLRITTMSGIRGFEVTAIYGHVSGEAIRNSAQDLNENTLAETRERATSAMWNRARRKGANFVIGLRFQSNFVSLSKTEIVAAGTAVRMVACPPTLGSAPDNQNAEQQIPNKSTKGQKNTGVPVGEPQNGKNKNKGKRTDGRSGQATEDSAGYSGWGQPVADAETSDQGDESVENTQNGWKGWGQGEDNEKKKNGTKGNQQAGSKAWGSKTEDAQTTKKSKKDNPAPKSEPAPDPSAGWGWNQLPEEQDDNDKYPNGATNAGDGPSGCPNEDKKGNKGNKADKATGSEPQRKGNKEKAKQARDNSENQATATSDHPPKHGVPSQVGYGPMNPGAMVNRSQDYMAYSRAPNLPVVHSSKPWTPSDPPRHDYGHPRGMYHYRPAPGYEQEYWNRHGPGFDVHPMYHNYPPFPMPAPLLSPQHPYGSSLRPPMQLEWAAGGDGHAYQNRPEVANQYPTGDHPPSNRSNKPNNTGDSTMGDNQAPQKNPNKNSNAKGKGKPTNQTTKKGGPPPQPDDGCVWGNWPGNEECGNDNSNEDKNEFQNTWNTNQDEGKKSGGKGAKNSAKQSEYQRQPNQNGKSKARKQSPPPPSASSSPDNDETEDGDGMAMGLFNMMSANHCHPLKLSNSAYSSVSCAQTLFFLV